MDKTSGKCLRKRQTRDVWAETLALMWWVGGLGFSALLCYKCCLAGERNFQNSGLELESQEQKLEQAHMSQTDSTI